MTQLPTLYKKTKTNKVQQCSISVTENLITVTWGQVGGAIQTKDTICKGKNIGRSNETSPQEQALLEAKSKWTKKLDEGYTEDPSGKVEVKLPMKVKVYQDNKKNVQFPCYGSPKLNGVNSLFKLEDDGTLTHWSRGGKPYPPLEHETESIISALNDLKIKEVNGETYCHGMFLEDITSAVKKPNENTPKLKFYAFEFPDVDLEFEDKRYILHGSNFATPEIVELNSHEEIEEYRESCVKSGYEGIVIRNGSCKYEYNIRSSHAFKFKKDLDEEFKILSYEVDKNGHPVFTLDNPKGISDKHKTFKAKPKGTAAERVQMIEDFETKYKDKWITVEFESWSKYGVPLKPKCANLRECDENGKPLE